MTSQTILLLDFMVALGITINIVTGAIELDFRVTPAVVKPLETANVSLLCVVAERRQYYQQTTNYYYDAWRYTDRTTIPPPRSDDKVNIAMLRIVKNFQDKWQPIVQINKVGSNIVHKLDSSITNTSGVISEDITQRSFIRVSWNIANADVFGMYRCDAITFDSQQNALLTISSQLSLGGSLDALALLRLLKHETADIMDRVDTLKNDVSSNHNLTEQLKTDILTLEDESTGKQFEIEQKVKEQSEYLKSQGEKTDMRITQNEKEITERIKAIEGKIKAVFDSGFLMLWPRGSFGLLKPESGCPLDGTWASGWRRHHTESTDRNKDIVSTESHLQQPVLERKDGNNFVNQHFCIKTDDRTVGPTWPKGSYCINKKGRCPVFFHEGFIKWDEEDSAKLETFGGQLPDGDFNDSGTVIIYCCRRDGPANVPIYLPSLDPFYLYRYGGECQNVYNMKVTEEFVVFDTENKDNGDMLGLVHPDGTIDNVHLDLCYYTRY